MHQGELTDLRVTSSVDLLQAVLFAFLAVGFFVAGDKLGRSGGFDYRLISLSVICTLQCCYFLGVKRSWRNIYRAIALCGCYMVLTLLIDWWRPSEELRRVPFPQSKPFRY
jgi:hypothetical protein